MNLSKITRVGFIPNFDRNGSYPEFGYKGEITPVKPAAIRATASPLRVVTDEEANAARKRAGQLKYKKAIIKHWKKTHRGHIAVLAATTALN